MGHLVLIDKHYSNWTSHILVETRFQDDVSQQPWPQPMFFEGPNDDSRKHSKIMAPSTEGLQGVDLETTQQRISRMLTWISWDPLGFLCISYLCAYGYHMTISYFGMCLLMM